MDMPRQDSPHYQGYSTSSASESGYYPEDHSLQDFSFDRSPDPMEEDALNEKSCVQVLKIWIKKADEDIVKLEEDILMLQCQLLWDDDKWSKQCSAALREKIGCLDTSIENLKKDNRENGLQSESEELPPRLHDLLKPLLETHLAKSEQTETNLKDEQTETNFKDEQTEASTIKMPVPPAVELSNKKMEENASSVMLKTYERKSKSTELEERKITFAQQVNLMKPRTEASSKVLKIDAFKCSINANALAVKKSVKMKGKNIKIAQTPQAVKDVRTEQVKEPRIEFEDEVQVQEKCHHKSSLPAEHKHNETSSAENVNEQRKDGVLEGVGKNSEKQTENIASEVTATSTLMPREVGKSWFSSEIKSSPMKLVKLELVASNITTEEAVDGVKNVSRISSPCNKEKGLTIAELKAIAKSQNLRGYTKFKKEELKYFLGLG